jgi:hypothetical protein
MTKEGEEMGEMTMADDDTCSREAFAAKHFQRSDGSAWQVRDYQRLSLESQALRKVHCDGRDVGKTTEIEIVACHAMMTMPHKQMLIATQTENHLFPLMHRLARRFETTPAFSSRVSEIRRSPSWYLRFDNGFTLWGRIAGPRGVNFQGMHVDWLIVDEAQEMGEISWGELFQALNGGGRRWIYGVPNGMRNTFYRMTQMQDAEQHNWRSDQNPDFTPEKNAELAHLYGGITSTGYIHRVLGLHGEPMHAVFALEDYLGCVDVALDHGNIVLREGDPLELADDFGPGDYYLGCDLGYARDPSEFVVYRNSPPHLANVLRVRLEGVNYARQQQVIEALDEAFNFRMMGIDAGNNGRAVSHHLMSLGPEWCDRITAIEFGSSITLDPLPNGTPCRRPAKEYMTELLQRRLAERTVRFPPIPERESQYASHTYEVNSMGRIIYDKGNDHIIDADRCALYAHDVDTREEYGGRAGMGVAVIGF